MPPVGEELQCLVDLLKEVDGGVCVAAHGCLGGRAHEVEVGHGDGDVGVGLLEAAPHLFEVGVGHIEESARPFHRRLLILELSPVFIDIL